MTEPSFQWLASSLIILIAISCWISINLIFNQTGNRFNNRLLGAFVFIQIIPLANVYSKITFGSNAWSWVVASNLIWLYGPFLFAFLHVLRKKSLSFSQLMPHFFPFIVTLLFRYSPFSPDYIPWYLIAVMFIQVSMYVIYAINLLRKQWQHISANIKNYKTAQFYWLSYLLAGIFILIFMDTFFYVKSIWFEPMNESDWFILVVFISLYLHGIAFCSIYRPNVFYNDCVEFITAPATKLGRDYKELDEGLAESLSGELSSVMENKKPYLLNDLTLQNLADMLSLNKHQLSELLNVHLSKSFYDYINQFRISHAKALLKNKEIKQGILDIAFESGFNNKNSFYRIFKDSTGQTPTQYRRSSPS